MLPDNLVYLLNVIEMFNLWQLPIHWEAKSKRLCFESQLKFGYCISSFVICFGFGSTVVLLGSQAILPNVDRIPAFILALVLLWAVFGLYTVFMQILQYTWGSELIHFFFHIESIKTELRNRGKTILLL
jgi:hypothetical protein